MIRFICVFLITLIYLTIPTIGSALSVEEILKLKEAGVSDDVIKTIIENSNGNKSVSRIPERPTFSNQISIIREGLSEIKGRYGNDWLRDIYDDGFFWEGDSSYTDHNGILHPRTTKRNIKYSDVYNIEKKKGRALGSGFRKKYYIIFRSKNNKRAFNPNAPHRNCSLMFYDKEDRDVIFNAMMELRQAGYNGNAPPTAW